MVISVLEWLPRGRIRSRSTVTTNSEVLELDVMKMDLMGDEELKLCLSYPRHEFLISENVARIFRTDSLNKFQDDPSD